MSELELSVSEFVALVNQTLEFAYPNVTIIGELANFRISKNQWVYFDLKDEVSSVKFFGTVYHLPGPLEDGLLLRVKALPRLHPKFGFNLNVLSLEPAGKGSIKRAANLLEAKLASEGLFDPARKRSLPYPPLRIGLVTSLESAAYSDFIKIMNARWGGVDISVIDVQVQGEMAAEQVTAAIEWFNSQALPPEVLVITRGGGSAEDLQTFSTEMVVRAVAASRIPTLVAVGHERDISLAELAADQRASTPSNAAELLVPDHHQELKQLKANSTQLLQILKQRLEIARQDVKDYGLDIMNHLQRNLERTVDRLIDSSSLLEALSPKTALRRGFILVKKGDQVVRSVKVLAQNDQVSLEFSDGLANANISAVKAYNLKHG